MRAPDRSGFGSLVSAIALLGLLGSMAFLHFSLSRQTLGSVQRNHLAALARVQARSALEELLDQISRDANDPEAPLFRVLRQSLDEGFATLDLKAHLRPPAIFLAPSWGRKSEGPARARPVEGRILDFLAVLRSPRRSQDPTGTEEWVAVLTLAALAEMKSPAGSVQRYFSASYEVRALLPGPPRPFDQVPVFLGDYRALLDPGAVNRLRQEFLDGQAHLKARLQTLAASHSGDAAARLRELADSIRPADQVEKRATAFSEDAGTLLYGPYHAKNPFPGSMFDLVSQLEATKLRWKEQDAKLNAVSSDPDQAPQAAYELIHALSMGLHECWLYTWAFHLVPREDEAFERDFGSSLERLTPGYFLDRVHLRSPPDSGLVERWLAGRARLNGILDMRGGEQVTLTGAPRGRVTVLTDAPRVTLEELQAGAREDFDDRLTLVSLGGDVEVRGEVEASVILLPREDGSRSGGFRLQPGATLYGNLVAPSPPPDSIRLQGDLSFDNRLLNPFPPSRALFQPGAGPYVFVVSPAPIFLEGVDS